MYETKASSKESLEDAVWDLEKKLVDKLTFEAMKVRTNQATDNHDDRLLKIEKRLPYLERGQSDMR